jgi:hypothetical protein
MFKIFFISAQILTKLLASLLWFKIFSRFTTKLDFSNSMAITERESSFTLEPEISPEVDPKQDAHTETHYVYPAKLHCFLIKTIPKRTSGLAIVIFLYIPPTAR